MHSSMRKSLILNFISCGRILPIGFIALIFAAAVGGTSFAGNPDFNLRLVEAFVCPDDSRLTYRLGEYSEIEEVPSASMPIGGTTGGRDIFAYCIQSGEVVRSGNGLLGRALALILSGYFLACFIPLLLTSGLLFGILRRLVNKQNGAE